MHGLDKLDIGRSARVLGFTVDCAMRRRLLDLGFTEGAGTACLLSSASGNPRAYSVRGAVIALRNEDARSIVVAPMEEELP